jgi:hypothetical protein
MQREEYYGATDVISSRYVALTRYLASSFGGLASPESREDMDTPLKVECAAAPPAKTFGHRRALGAHHVIVNPALSHSHSDSMRAGSTARRA